ncbi:AAA domain-containing protein, partial [Streptomyces sp. NPDC059378]|uniref:AAA domain-containing protein n=1 Tax=Streptomyces sp. NPDC059378 TaxID=3346815 RepID=UPI0036C480DE
MRLRTVDVPGNLVLVPGAALEAELLRRRTDHLPEDVHDLAADLGGRERGVPAIVAEPRRPGGDRSLLLYGRSYVARLYRSRREQGAYRVAAVLPLGFRHHRDIERGCLLVRPGGWLARHPDAGVPAGSDTHWPLLEDAWRRLTEELAARHGAPGLAERHARFLDTVERAVDTVEEITADRARETGDFPYRAARAAGERRHGTRAVYTFDLAVDRLPDEGAFVQISGERDLRGQVVRAPAGGTSVTVSFDRAVDWDSVPRQGALQLPTAQAVHERRREAVRILRERRSLNPHLLDVLVDHRVRPSDPAPDALGETLDPAQTEAFRRALSAEDLMLVLGPPGTGKTRVISEIARAVAARPTRERVLIASHSNRAVDNVLGRLPKDLVVVRVGNESRVTPEGRPYLLEEQAAGLRQEILGRLETRLAARGDIKAVQEWYETLGRLLDRLGTLAAEETVRRAALAEARRAVGGPALTRVDELLAERRRLDREEERGTRRTERLTRSRDAALRRTGLRPVGFVFRFLARRRARRLARAKAAAAALAGRRARQRRDLAEAE